MSSLKSSRSLEDHIRSFLEPIKLHLEARRTTSSLFASTLLLDDSGSRGRSPDHGEVWGRKEELLDRQAGADEEKADRGHGGHIEAKGVEEFIAGLSTLAVWLFVGRRQQLVARRAYPVSS